MSLNIQARTAAFHIAFSSRANIIKYIKQASKWWKHMIKV